MLRNASPVSVHYRHEPGTLNEWLFLGCDDGCVTCFIFLDAKNNQKQGHFYLDPLQVPAHLNFSDYVDFRQILNLHSDHITQIQYIEELGCLLTASLDGTLKLTQMDDAGRKIAPNYASPVNKKDNGGGSGGPDESHFDGVTHGGGVANNVDGSGGGAGSSSSSGIATQHYSRRRVKYTFRGHRTVVRSFAWCWAARLVASCGQERTIKVWAPYSSSYSELKGHQAPVVQVRGARAHMVVAYFSDGMPPCMRTSTYPV